ncbi:glycoside hydrolase [Lojkania enalia]|uniref:AA9 family lytic polysaccharide monooxygenase n=1 Tax=Lojkania enalia TaxID=147567 RepID=A0A9P4N798_9PLEO|nr:glycoside hydrolase [Didymosphaeria enalia]
MHSRTIATCLLACVPLIASHGGGMHYIIDGVVHSGVYSKVLNTETGSIQRMWTWDSIDQVSNPFLACRIDGSPYKISYHAPIRAGSIVSVNYTIPGSDWTFGHPIGPMLAYMAACPEVGCEGVDLRAPIWFKIWQAGLLSGTYADGYWAMKDVMDGANLDIPTPSSLKPGKYLLKHDMLNLQTGPPQWFPNCIQLEVSGSGSSLPDAKDLVAFPGGYDNGEGSWPTHGEGSRWLYVDHANDTDYPMPGPPVWQA